MEGVIARWYAKNTARDVDRFRRAAELDLLALAARSRFGGCELREEGVGFELRLSRWEGAPAGGPPPGEARRGV